MSEADAEAAEPTPARPKSGSRSTGRSASTRSRATRISSPTTAVRRTGRPAPPHVRGPAGTGKCVTGETPVLTNEGISPISAVVGGVDGFGDPDDDLEILTYDNDGTFEYVSPSHVFRRTQPILSRSRPVTATSSRSHRNTSYSSRTNRDSSGGRLEGFPGGTYRSTAEDARGRRPVSSLDWLSSMDGERTFVTVSESFARRHEIPAEENYVGQKNGDRLSPTRLFDRRDRFRLRYPSKTATDYARTVSIDLHVPSTTCSLSYLRSLDVEKSELRSHVERIQYVTRYNKRSSPITPPWELTPDLARFVGLAVSEARIENGRIKFYNTDRTLCETFERIAQQLFDAETTRGVQKGVPYVDLRTKSLHHFLESCFDVFGDSHTAAIGSTLVHASEDARAAFLQAVFDSEAYVATQGRSN